MKKLSTTWRHQKTFVDLPHASKQNEQLQFNLGKRRLGRLPIAPASVTVKTPASEELETPTVASYKSDDGNNGDIPASFLSSFSASIDSDLIHELEKVEAALTIGICKSESEFSSTSPSKLVTQKKKGNVHSGMKSSTAAVSSKLTSKRKHITAPVTSSLEVHSDTAHAKPSAICSHKSILSAVSPTKSPMDKRAKQSVITTRSQILSNNNSMNCKSLVTPAVSKKCSDDFLQEATAVCSISKVSCSKENKNTDDSFIFSDISFSPLSSLPGSDVDVSDNSEDESPKNKPSVCRTLRVTNKKPNITMQKGQSVGLCHRSSNNTWKGQLCSEDLNASSAANNELIRKKAADLPSGSNQKRTFQTHFSDVNIKKGRKSRFKIHSDAAASLDGASDKSYTACGDNKKQSLKCERSLITAHEDKNTPKRSGICERDQHKADFGIHSSHNVLSSESTSKDKPTSFYTKTQGSEKEQSNSSSSGDIKVLMENSVGNVSLTADKRQLSSWGLPEPVLETYRSQGVLTMFEWQAECLLTDNVLDGGNLVYSAPTSAGKTLVAELLILKRVLESRKKALFILPFVSVAREKMYSLQQLYQNAGIKVGGYMGSYSPPGGFSQVHVAVCTIEKGNGLINRLMEEGKLGELGAVVIDELHMVGDSHRGYLLELMLTKLAYISRRAKDKSSDCQIQIIGMSATLPNLAVLAKWLNASLYRTDFRPIPLTEYIKVDTRLLNGQLIVQRQIPALLTSPDDTDHVIALCIETVADGHSVLVFCPTKNWCEKLCEAVARRFYGLMHLSQDTTSENKGESEPANIPHGIKINLDRERLVETVEQLKRSPVGLDPFLGKCVLNGVAYHHAGLTFDERDIVEGAFRQGHLKVVVATSTLSSGVNLPARRVIIRTPMFCGKIIDALTYKQMAGRAGRKGIDTEGESVLICKPQEQNAGKKLLESELPAVESCLHFNADEKLSGSLKRAILEVVVSGVAPTPKDLIAYVNCTLLSASLSDISEDNLKEALLNSCIRFLQENEFVTVNIFQCEDGTETKKFYPTQLGSAILSSSLSPDEGLLVFAELQKARRAFVLDTELHIIYLVTPVYASDVSASIDWYHFHHLWEVLTPADRRVAELVGVSESFIARAIQGRISGKTEAQRKSLAIHQRFYTALILNCLVQEVPLMEVAAKFNCNKGQLQSLQQSASSYAGMITVFCGRLGWHSLELILSQFHKRLSFGVQQELVDLVRISALNASSARMLYNSGYHTVTDVARAEPSDIENLFRNAVPFQSEKRQDGETDWELQERRRARCIWLTGRKGVTELDAALAIIEEAKVIVQGDLGVTGINWGGMTKVKGGNVADSSGEHEKSSFSDDCMDSNESTEFDDRGDAVMNCLYGARNTNEEASAVHRNGTTSEMSEQKNNSRGVGNSSYQEGPEYLSEGKLFSSAKRRTSREGFRKNGNSHLSDSNSQERSFFGQMVVSPPEGVRNRVSRSFSRTIVGRIACLSVRSEECEAVHVLNTHDGKIQQQSSGATDPSMQVPDRRDKTAGTGATPTAPCVSSNVPVTTATISTSGHQNVNSQNCSSVSCALSFHTTKSCAPKEQRSIDKDISFSESFELDTQTANIINHNAQVLEENWQAVNDSSPNKSTFLASKETTDCLISKKPVSIIHSVQHTPACSVVLEKHVDDSSRAVSPDPFIDSLSEALFLDSENPGQNTACVVAENLHQIFSEPLFISTENLPQHKPVAADETTPERIKTKPVYLLSSYHENSMMANNASYIESPVSEHSENVVDTSLNQNHEHQISEFQNGENDICSSLIAPSNFERLMHLDEGMLEEEASQKLNYVAGDSHIFRTGAGLNTSGSLTSCENTQQQDKNKYGKGKENANREISNSGLAHVEPTDSSTYICDEEAYLAAAGTSDSFFLSSVSQEPGNEIGLPRNSTPAVAVNARRQNIKHGLQQENVKQCQTGTEFFSKEEKRKNDEKIIVSNQTEGDWPKTIGAEEQKKESGLDELFTDSFCSSFMDRLMAECENISETKDGRNENTSNVNSTGAFIRSAWTNRASTKKGKENVGQDSCKTPPSASKVDAESASNNSSRNDGSDCIPPTPPDETSKVASPFRMSFFSPGKLNVAGPSSSFLTPKRGGSKLFISNKCKRDYTAIKNRETEDGERITNLNMDDADLNSLQCSSRDVQSSKSTNYSDNSNNSINRRSTSNIASNRVNISPRGNDDNSFNSHEHNQCIPASQLLTQQSFTIVDICADRRLFHTFLEELKSQRYYALSVACEKKPPEHQQKAVSVIGGRFLKKRTPPSVLGPKTVIGIPVPDSDAFIVGLSISWENRDSYFVSLMSACNSESDESDPDDPLAEPQLDETLTQEERISLLVAALMSSNPGSSEQTVAVYDSKTAYVYLAKALGLSLLHCEDPCVADWLIEPTARLKNLHRMVVSHCPEELPLLDAVGGISGYRSMGSDIKSKVSGRLRACTESVLTMKLMMKYHTVLDTEHLLAAFRNVEMPGIITLARMELNGFGVSESELERQKKLMAAKLNILEQQAYKMAGHVFSLTSTIDVATVLYHELKLPVNGDPSLVIHLPTHGRRGGRTSTGSASKEILEKLQKYHPLPAVILEWRRVSSALTKSLFALQHAARACLELDMVRVFGECQVFTSTGRVSMTEPNLQNIPKDFAVDLPDLLNEDQGVRVPVSGTKAHRKSQRFSGLEEAESLCPRSAFARPVSMRKMFVPFSGGVILAADYSQLELRIIAHLSRDSKLASILNTKDGDVFKMIAAQLKGQEIGEVSVEHRQQAKQVCYGMLYGIGPKALGEQLGLDENDAGAFMETFKSRYPGVRKYLHETVEFCQKNGYVKTLFNRRRYLPSIKKSNPYARAQAERQAVNTTIQGSAADLVKVAMTNIDRKLMDLFPDTKRCHSQSHPGKGLLRNKNHKVPKVTGAFLVLQLHDELIYEVSANQVPEVAVLVQHCMETAVELSVSLPVKIKVGPTWGELVDYEIIQQGP